MILPHDLFLLRIASMQHINEKPRRLFRLNEA
jgi:hypothetical protein